MNKVSGIFLLVAVSLISGGCLEVQVQTSPRDIRFSSGREGIVKAMTFNIRVDTLLDGLNRWGKRKQIVFDTIADNRADVVGLQEARNSQVKQIQQALPEYTNYSAGRSNGDKKGESCAIFYRKDRFELIDSGTFWFSNTPSKAGSKGWGNINPRICSWVHLSEKEADTGLYVYNLHLDNLSQKSRKKSVELLAKQVATRKNDDPFIVMGDFNMKLGNPAMQYLQKIGYKSPYPKMVDSWKSFNRGQAETGTRHGFSGKITGPQIDHIPVSENSRVLEVKIDRREVNGRYPSDHFPVIATILLEKPS